MRLAVDVMGFDNGIIEAIKACRVFKQKHAGVEIVLVGDESQIKPLLTNKDNFSVVHAASVVHTEEPIIQTLRNNETSMYKAVKLVADNTVDGVLSAGSTAAYVSLTYSLIGTIKGINKPAFMSYLPTINGKGIMMLDEGANISCSGKDLHQFGMMASIYCKVIRGIHNPSIGLLNIGTEKVKGHDYHREGDELFSKDSSLNYKGFYESRNILNGEIDILVSDGYSGNIALKALEGSLKTISSLLKSEFKKPWNIPGAILSMGVIKKITHTFNYKKYAGAYVLGLNKMCLKTHGNAKQEEFVSALGMLYDAVNKNLVEKIRANIKHE